MTGEPCQRVPVGVPLGLRKQVPPQRVRLDDETGHGHRHPLQARRHLARQRRAIRGADRAQNPRQMLQAEVRRPPAPRPPIRGLQGPDQAVHRGPDGLFQDTAGLAAVGLGKQGLFARKPHGVLRYPGQAHDEQVHQTWQATAQAARRGEPLELPKMAGTEARGFPEGGLDDRILSHGPLEVAEKIIERLPGIDADGTLGGHPLEGIVAAWSARDSDRPFPVQFQKHMADPQPRGLLQTCQAGLPIAPGLTFQVGHENSQGDPMP